MGAEALLERLRSRRDRASFLTSLGPNVLETQHSRAGGGQGGLPCGQDWGTPWLLFVPFQSSTPPLEPCLGPSANGKDS